MVENPRSHVLSLCSRRGIFIKTAMTCSQTGGMVVGADRVTNVGMVSGGLAGGGGGGGGGVEASGAAGEPEHTRPLGGVDIVWGGS